MFEYTRKFLSLFFGRGSNQAQATDMKFSEVLTTRRPEIMASIPRYSKSYFHKA